MGEFSAVHADRLSVLPTSASFKKRAACTVTQKLDLTKILMSERSMRTLKGANGKLAQTFRVVAKFGFTRFVWPCSDDSDDICQ